MRSLTRAVHWMPLFAAVVSGGVVLLRGLTIVSGGDELIVQAVPDDAFYYIVLAKRFATSFAWTFDGVRPTTGFHLAWAYLLAGFFRMLPAATLQQTFAFGAVFASLCHAAAAYIVVRGLGRVLPSVSVAAAATLVFCAGTVPATALFCMESPLVLLAAAATCAAVTSTSPPTRRSAVGLCVLGVAGSLCRSDFLVLPAAFALTQAVFTRRVQSPAAWCLLGALLGLVLVTAHTYAISGSLVQASAATKARWSSMTGHVIGPALHALGLVLDTGLPPRPNITALVTVGILVGLAVFVARRDRERLCLAVAASAAIGGYVLLYKHNCAAIQPWYATSFAVPVLVSVSIALAGVERWASTVLVAAVLVTGASHLKRVDDARWPNQRAQMLAGLLLASEHRAEATGAWNAGVLSYFSGGRIVNLDGLVNDDVYTYVERNELLRYLVDQHIQWVADYGAMLSFDFARKLGGYDTANADKCLMKVKTMVDGPRWFDTDFTIYQVDAACIERARAGLSVR